MKKKRIITLICIAIVIGIISIILYGAFINDFSISRNKYYENLLTSLNKTGKEFFDDNSKYIPKDTFYSQKVSIGTLIENKYLNSIKDYNKNKCSDDSYVIIINNGNNNYSYNTCLVCPTDNYSNMEEDYCNSSWIDKSTVGYAIVNEPLLYVNKGITNQELKEKLSINLSLVKRDFEGKIIKVSNDKSSNMIIPNNIDKINPNVVGEYPLEYEYDGYVYQGKINIYENPMPKVSIGYSNIVLDNNKKEKIETGFLEEDRWVQKVIITLNKGDYYYSEISDVVKYQWNKDGKWQDICIGKDPCVKEVTVEMNEKVRFRSVDGYGNYSKESDEYLIRIDNTKPSCELSLSGNLSDNDWYNGPVIVSFSNNNDTDKNNLTSGTKVSNISINDKSIDRVNSNNQKTQIVDTLGTTYYGYVEDKAGNYSLCSISLKKDSTSPTCLSSGDSEKWTNKSRTISYGCMDSLSGCNKSYSGGEEVFSTTLKTTTIPSYTIMDNAGNSTICEERVANIYVDKTSPTCSYSGESTEWTKEDRTITYGCDDLDSGCLINGGSRLFNFTIKRTIIPSYTIVDNAGNSTFCDKKEVDVYVDKKSPTCNVVKTEVEKEDGISVTINCDDKESGCQKDFIISNKITSNTSYVIEDNVGNRSNCEVEVIQELYRRDAKCDSYLLCQDNSCGMEDYDCDDCKTGHNTCVSGIDYGKWGMCSLTKEECQKIGNNECEACGNDGYYHSRDLINNPCKTGENTCQYGCSKRAKTCNTKACGCSAYGSFGNYYQVTKCESTTNNEEIVECKILYK